MKKGCISKFKEYWEAERVKVSETFSPFSQLEDRRVFIQPPAGSAVLPSSFFFAQLDAEMEKDFDP